MASQGPPVPATDPVPAAGTFGPLFADGRRQHLRPGTVLFNEGDISSRVALILSGRLKVSSFSEDGRETVLGLRGRGDLFGEFAAIDGHPHSATVTVVEPTEALIVPADRFVAALEARPQLALELLRGVILRLRDADRRRVEFAGLSVDGRIARRLVELADELGDQLGDEGLDPGAPPVLSTTQAELAAWAGCSREAVNKAIGRFRDQGLISVSRGHIAVLDLEGLRGRIDG
jgi:CRP/FNR family cyclic AMP-dependent transcriptional regulator